MADKATWAKWVAEWRASGLASPAFSEGKPFSASGLRYWAWRLRTEVPVPAPPAQTSLIRLGRVLRIPAAEVPVPTPPATPLVVECGGLRVAVRPGFDRATLAAVLDVLATRCSP